MSVLWLLRGGLAKNQCAINHGKKTSSLAMSLKWDYGDCRHITMVISTLSIFFLDLWRLKKCIIVKKKPLSLLRNHEYLLKWNYENKHIIWQWFVDTTMGPRWTSNSDMFSKCIYVIFLSSYKGVLKKAVTVRECWALNF